jgi:hypothetical protein
MVIEHAITPGGRTYSLRDPWATVLAGASIVNFRPTGYGYLSWITTADRTPAFFASVSAAN